MFDPTNPIPQWTVSTMRRIAAEPTLAATALRFANLGIPVFPCVPGGKQPLTPNGFHDATAAARIVHDWWQRAPEANIGLPTGARTGVMVVDVDRHVGGSGFAAFERARAEGLAEGWGWMVRTPSGGIHAYYPTTPNREQRSWQIPSAHIDFRGDGGYIIAPPSRITVDGASRSYQVIATSTRPPETIDAGRLREFLEPSRRTPPVPAAGLAPGLSTGGCRPEALARVVALTPEGGRNRALFWASCRMVEAGQSRDSARGYLTPAAQHAGLPDREIESTIDSAYRVASRLSPAHGPGSRLGPTPLTTPSSEAVQL
ncbi:bifunctional DNA primase/polymerase [Nocardioides sp. YIM 152315]|uniref:bifunctional DNA primase/polymerase n=1 Tax=Nocardioides sp. YIM 152315 TaxID=3031760 RepID=UPI0023DB8B4B|nr:bifunctional DNA primase/polymerase [Nocardioides sp. YIM 152315]MDF1605886.1 bifunctional DNA primase/polymerase [Nocardioides sp. YIM 152315]